MAEASGLMRGKRGLIMGVANNRSIAWGIAKACRAQGAELAFTYQGDALKKRVEPLAQEVGGLVVGHCDVTEPATIDAVFAEIAAKLGRARFPGARHRLLRQGPAHRPLCRHHGGQFRQDDADQLLLVHRDRPARREADAERRLAAHAHLLRRREVDAALQRDGRRQGRAGSVGALSRRRSRRRRTSASTRISAGPIKTLAAVGIGDFRYILKWNELQRAAAPHRDDRGGRRRRGLFPLRLSRGVTGEIHHVDAGYHIVGMKHPDAPDISVVERLNAASHALLSSATARPTGTCEGRLQGSTTFRSTTAAARRRAQCGEILRDLFARDGREPADFDYVSSPLVRARETMESCARRSGLPPQGYAHRARLAGDLLRRLGRLHLRRRVKRDEDVVAEREATSGASCRPAAKATRRSRARVGDWYATLERDTVVAAHGGTGAR